MLTKRECEEKLEEIAYLKSTQSENSETGREYIAHLSRLEKAYRDERIKAIVRMANEDDSELGPISKGMYAY